MRWSKKVPLLLTALTVVLCLIACGSVHGDDRQPETSGESKTQSIRQVTETNTEEEKEPENEPETESIAAFDLENRLVRLNSGYDMPVAGLGTYALSHDECVASVTALFKNGGRLVDTASFYGTEKSVGEAVRNSNVPREEIFVTTKLYPNPFLGEMEEILESQREKQIKLKKELGARWRSGDEFDDLVFTTGMGSPCSRYIVQKEIKKAVKRMREKEAVTAVQEKREPNVVRDFHLHTLRHTFATRCFENKMEPKVVQALLGHSSISITLNIYTHVLDKKMEEELQKFGSAKTQEREAYAGLDVKKVKITSLSHC